MISHKHRETDVILTQNSYEEGFLDTVWKNVVWTGVAALGITQKVN